MILNEWNEAKVDNELTQEEIDQYEEAYKEWEKELNGAIDSGNEVRIEEIYEQGQ